MKAQKRIGIDITELDGSPLSSGNLFYWNAVLSNILLHEAHEFCPEVDYKPGEGKSYQTRFRRDNAKGVELCGDSESLENPKIRIPEGDLDRFVMALDQMHKKSEQPGIPSDNRAFMRNFVVPNPLVMKSAWRVSTGFTRHLLVLWGYEGGTFDAAILPLTPTSSKWPDASQRKDLRELLNTKGKVTKSNLNWGKLSRYVLWVLLLLGVLALLVWGIIRMGYCSECGAKLQGGKCRNMCSVHPDVHLDDYGGCPKICPLHGQHLDKNGECPKQCVVCHECHDGEVCDSLELLKQEIDKAEDFGAKVEVWCSWHEKNDQAWGDKYPEKLKAFDEGFYQILAKGILDYTVEAQNNNDNSACVTFDKLEKLCWKIKECSAVKSFGHRKISDFANDYPLWKNQFKVVAKADFKVLFEDEAGMLGTEVRLEEIQFYLGETRPEKPTSTVTCKVKLHQCTSLSRTLSIQGDLSDCALYIRMMKDYHCKKLDLAGWYVITEPVYPFNPAADGTKSYEGLLSQSAIAANGDTIGDPQKIRITLNFSTESDTFEVVDQKGKKKTFPVKYLDFFAEYFGTTAPTPQSMIEMLPSEQL